MENAHLQDSILSVENLTVSFDGFKVVDDLSLQIKTNELRVIIGPNGAGKTTVLDLISGRTSATSGSIKFRGQELRNMKEHEIVHAGIGRKFQTPSVFEDLTVFENLENSVLSSLDEIKKCRIVFRKLLKPHISMKCFTLEQAH